MNINLTLIGQLLSFVVFVWFTMKFVWTPIMGALETRKKEIAAGLAAARPAAISFFRVSSAPMIGVQTNFIVNHTNTTKESS